MDIEMDPKINATEIKSEEENLKIVKRVEKNEHVAKAFGSHIPFSAGAGIIQQNIEWHKKHMGESGESEDFEKGYLCALQKTLELMEKATSMTVKALMNGDL